MKSNWVRLLLSLSLLFLLSCQDEKIPEIEGDFRGTFSVDYENSETISGPFNLVLLENGNQHWYSAVSYTHL